MNREPPLQTKKKNKKERVNPESAGKKKESLAEERDPPSCFLSKLSFLHLNTCFYIAFHCKRTFERREKGMVETFKAHSFSSPVSKTPIFFYQSGRNCHAIFIQKERAWDGMLL